MDKIQVSGHVVVRKNDKVIREGHNLVVNAGLELIASLLYGTGTAPGYMAMGDGTTSPAGSQTALVHETHRGAATKAHPQNSVSYTRDFTGSNSGVENVAEFGIFNASSAGTMLSRFICPIFELAVGDTLVVDWTINIGAET